jgi:hypothetical protein
VPAGWRAQNFVGRVRAWPGGMRFLFDLSPSWRSGGRPVISLTATVG